MSNVINTTIRELLMLILEARDYKQFNKWMSEKYPHDDINLFFKYKYKSSDTKNANRT